MEVNEAGEIIITLKHGDSKVLITPDHSLYARLKAIIDSGASVCLVGCVSVDWAFVFLKTYSMEPLFAWCTPVVV